MSVVLFLNCEQVVQTDFPLFHGWQLRQTFRALPVGSVAERAPLCRIGRPHAKLLPLKRRR